MKKEEIFLSDIRRILLGDAPPGFLLEVLVRTLMIYIVLLVILRLLGKRMNGQLTITEMAVMIVLGAIVGSPVQLPDRGVLVAAFILFCILILHRVVTLWIYKNEKVEKLTQGTVILLVKNGVLQLKEMGRSNISRQQVFSQLRKRNIYQLGKIKRMYLEACGLFSIYQNDASTPGMSILPPGDDQIQEIVQSSRDIIVCHNCGNTKRTTGTSLPCPNCGQKKWGNAVT
jgi:uncharacterized membrane protein YcaP (DUF421 family)